MDIAIRFATVEDADEILKIYAPYIKDTAVSFEIDVPSIEEFKNRIASILADYPYLVCEYRNKIVGYAYASKHRERAAYRYSVDVSVYILPKYHRQGIGKNLYTRLFELLRERGFYTAYAGITLPNEKSIGLHTALGFTTVGVFHNTGYKFGKWWDVVWLEKPLREYGDAGTRGCESTMGANVAL